MASTFSENPKKKARGIEVRPTFPPELHGRALAEAQRLGISLNDVIVMVCANGLAPQAPASPVIIQSPAITLAHEVMA